MEAVKSMLNGLLRSHPWNYHYRLPLANKIWKPAFQNGSLKILFPFPRREKNFKRGERKWKQGLHRGFGTNFLNRKAWMGPKYIGCQATGGLINFFHFFSAGFHELVLEVGHFASTKFKFILFDLTDSRNRVKQKFKLNQFQISWLWTHGQPIFFLQDNRFTH